ncbi:MAG: helix-turn-helix domain-containing protein, partial [Oscillospiraceae bacterium]|nr:helix-turn-helix domain-containing protein [Oscillospiraceae bacterium]
QIAEEEQLLQQIRVYQESCQLPCTVRYYPREGNWIYASDEVMGYERFQQSGGWRDELDMIQFYIKLNTVQRRTLLTTCPISGDKTGSYLAYLSPVPSLAASPSGTLAFLVNRQYFDDMVKKDCGEFGGYLLILDTFYGISYAMDQCGEHDLNLVGEALSIPDGGQVAFTNIDGETFAFLRTVSTNYGFTYFYAIPTSVLYAESLRNVWVLALIGCGLMMTLILAAMLTTAHNCRPFLQLAGDLIPDVQPYRTDLFEQIRLQYRSMESQNSSLQLQIRNVSLRGRQRLLSELLHGWRGDREQLTTALEQTGIRFRYGSFFVMLIRLEEMPDSSLETVQRSCSRLQELRRDGDVFLVEEAEPSVVAVLMNLEKNEEFRQQSPCELQQLLRAAGVRARIGVSLFHSDPFHINTAFCEGLVALQESTTVAFFQKPDHLEESLLCPSVEGKMLQQSLLSGSEETAARVLRGMCAAVEKQHPTYQASRCFCFYVVCLLIQIRPMLQQELPEEELLQEACHAELPRFCFTAEAVIRQICCNIRAARSSGEQKLVQDMMEYIDRNYGDYALSVETLAAQFSVSEKTVRQIVKEQTGMNLTGYLTTLRMNYIKKQLAETDIPVRELISQVGYTDVSSFTRKFRQMEGVTPGQYRAMHSPTGKAARSTPPPGGAPDGPTAKNDD